MEIDLHWFNVSCGTKINRIVFMWLTLYTISKNNWKYDRKTKQPKTESIRFFSWTCFFITRRQWFWFDWFTLISKAKNEECCVLFIDSFPIRMAIRISGKLFSGCEHSANKLLSFSICSSHSMQTYAHIFGARGKWNFHEYKRIYFVKLIEMGGREKKSNRCKWK